MDLNNLSIEINKSIKELNLNSIAELSANTAMANFIYLLNCLDRDFKLTQNKNTMTTQEEIKLKQEVI